MSSHAEVITWRDAARDPPDGETTVVVSVSGGSEPVWFGWLADGVWRSVSHGAAIDGTVVSWCDVPEGWFPGGAA